MMYGFVDWFGYGFFLRCFGAFFIIGCIVAAVKIFFHLFGLVNIAVVPVAKYNDRNRILDHSNENCIIAMPPAIVVNYFSPIRINIHSPAVSIITDARLFI